MKLIHPLFLVTIILIVISFSLSTNAVAEDNTCFLQSRDAPLYIVVYDVFPSETTGKLIWSGVIKGEQQIVLKSNYGRFYYEYSTEPESHTSMVRGFVRSCKDSEIVEVP
jgi:hypothetical protein